MSSSADPRARMEELVRERPLCHPGVFAMRYRDYEYAPPEHLRDIYGQVYRGVRRDGIKYLAHMKPREHGKSEGGTVDNAAWMACQDPASRTLILSEGSSLAEKKLGQVQDVVEGVASEYGLEVVEENNKRFELANDSNHGEATVEAAGFGSSITGGHFDLIVFDDLVDWPSQRTEARRDKIWKQFQNYLNLGSEGKTVYLVLGTRKHPDDLYNNLIQNDTWYTTVEAAIQDWSIVENNEYDLVTRNPDTREEFTYHVSDRHEIPPREVIVDTRPHRDVEVLWPERWPLNRLLHDMHAGFGADEGNLVWKRENQNVADALQGQILSADMLGFHEPPPEDRLQIGFGLDPAIEEDPEKAATNDTDYWALAKVGHDAEERRTYVLRTWRRRGMSVQKGIKWAQSKCGDYRGSLLVEDNQAQTWFVQTAKDHGLNARGTSTAGESKEDRIIAMASRFESGKVVLAGGEEHWTGAGAQNPKFINEWAGFPSASHDDRLDGIEIALRTVGGQTMQRGKHDMSDLPV